MKYLVFILLLLSGLSFSQVSYSPGSQSNVDFLRNDRNIKYTPIVINDQRAWSGLSSNVVTFHSSSGGKSSESGTTTFAATAFAVDSTVDMTIDTRPFMFFTYGSFDSIRIQAIVRMDANITGTLGFYIFRATREEMEFNTTNTVSVKSVATVDLTGYTYGMHLLDVTLAVPVNSGDYLSWGTWSSSAESGINWNVNIFGVKKDILPFGLVRATPDHNYNFENASEPFEAIPQRAANGTLDNGCFSSTDWDAAGVLITQVCVAQSVESAYNYDLSRSSTYSRNPNGNSLRSFLRATQPDSFPDPGGSGTHRAELRLEDFPSPGDEVWYGLSYYFPSDYVFSPSGGTDENNTRYIISQWQHGTAGSPAMALEVFSDSIGIDRKIGTSNGGETTIRNGVRLVKITKGQWMDFIIKVKWSKTKGEVVIWYNDEPVYADYDQNVYTDLSVGGSLKVGIYHFNWLDEALIAIDNAGGVTTREVFIDEIKQYTGTDGYYVVKPK